MVMIQQQKHANKEEGVIIDCTASLNVTYSSH